MAEIARDQAVRDLAQEVASLGPDDLAEVYSELFPSQPASEEQARQDPGMLQRRITEHFRRGLEPEEIVALWHLVFPTHWNVHYVEETNSIHYRDKAEPVGYAE